MIIKTALGLLIIIALVIGAIFFSNYFNDKAEAQSLASQIQRNIGAVGAIKAKTDQLNTEIVEISQNIDKTTSDISRESDLMPSKRINSNEIVKQILLLGQTKKVMVIPLNTQEWVTNHDINNDYQVFKINVEISGEQAEVVSFIQDLPYLYNSLVIENIEISKPDKSPKSEENQIDTQTQISQITAKVKLSIYTK